jgi:hypothetical protein
VALTLDVASADGATNEIALMYLMEACRMESPKFCFEISERALERTLSNEDPPNMNHFSFRNQACGGVNRAEKNFML